MTPQDTTCTDGTRTATIAEEQTRLMLISRRSTNGAHAAAMCKRLRQLRDDAIARKQAVLPWAPG